MTVQAIKQEATRSIDKVTAIIITHYIGSSTDIKPINCNRGSTFEETDTGNIYKFDGVNWYFTLQGSTGITPDDTPYNTSLSLFDLKNYEGKVFTFSKTSLAVANNGYFDVHIKAGSKPTYFEIFYNAELKARFSTYLNTVYSNIGVLANVFPRNSGSIYSSESKAYIAPTITTLGSLRGDDFVGNNTNPQTRAGGSTSSTGSILKENDDLLIRLQNVGGSVSDLNIIINLLEF